MDWFKSWHGAPLDDKWIVIAKQSETPVYVTSSFMWALLDHASQNEVRGQVSDFDFETYCAKSGMEEEIARRIYSALEKYPTGKEIIKEGQLVNWDKRQSNSKDLSTERVRKHREKKRSVTSETFHETVKHTDQTRPDQDQRREERTPLPPVSPRRMPTSTVNGSGSFASQGLGGLVGSSGSAAFDIRPHLREPHWRALLDYAPDWDRNAVIEKYNAFVQDSPPRIPAAAFLGWLKKNAGWLGKPP